MSTSSPLEAQTKSAPSDAGFFTVGGHASAKAIQFTHFLDLTMHPHSQYLESLGGFIQPFGLFLLALSPRR